MKLYHGTSEYVAQKALNYGLLPRAVTRESNWEHTVESNPEMVYLTDTYGCYFACNAKLNAPRVFDKSGNLSKRVAVIEIETSGLNFLNFRADEDFLGFADVISAKDKKLDLIERTNFHKNNTESADWKTSLKFLGTCAYKGKIRKKHISRIALFDTSANRTMAMAMMDAVVSPLAFKFVGSMHKALIKWLFGDSVSLEEINNTVKHSDSSYRDYWEQVFKDRSGIEIITLQ